VNMGDLLDDGNESGSRALATTPKSSDAPNRSQRGPRTPNVGKPRTRGRATAYWQPRSNPAGCEGLGSLADACRARKGCKSKRRSPGALKGCVAGRGAASWTQSREVRRKTSGPSDAPEGESWRGQAPVGKAGVSEDAYDAARPGPCDQAHARLPAPSSPGVHPAHPSPPRLRAMRSGAARATVAGRSRRLAGERSRSAARGGIGRLRRARHVQHHRHAGSPTGREPSGDGVLVGGGGGESPPQGDGGQVS
jgi:hypothetical protein